MSDEAEKVKPTELEDNPLVGYMVQQKWKLREKLVVKKLQTQLEKAPNTLALFGTESEDSGNERPDPVSKVKPTHPAKEKAPKSWILSKQTQRMQILRIPKVSWGFLLIAP